METDELIKFSVSVLSPFGVPRYLIIKPSITLGEARDYRCFLETLGHNYTFGFTTNTFSIIIKEPNWAVSDIALYNKEYFGVFGISELNKVKVLKPGDPLFWELFSELETLFVHHLLGNESSVALEDTCNCGESTITRATRAILNLVELKYPGQKFKTRKQFKVFAIKIGVLVPARCSQCKQKI
jgi:hypothetical protein